MTARNVLTLASHFTSSLSPYLPPKSPTQGPLPFTTLTYAQSLDSSLSLRTGLQTALSGPQSKSMTHYLRSHHTAILIGANTAITDNPSLNCRFEGVGGYGGQNLEGQPRPIVVDPRARWMFDAESKVVKLAREGKGLGLWIVCAEGWMPPADDIRHEVLANTGGQFIPVSPSPPSTSAPPYGRPQLAWRDILTTLRSQHGIQSVMIEGGASVINELLYPQNVGLVNSSIVTIAPTWLGQGSVNVQPSKRENESGTPTPVARLGDVKWVPMGEDVVLCGRPLK